MASSSKPLYDTIGRGYGECRREDPRIAVPILEALEGCSSIVNVGAGAGSYEPRDRRVVAVEPSRVMIGQRGAEAAPVVRATAIRLPFDDASFDASMAVLTIHHWPDAARVLRELRRVARLRAAVLTCDPSLKGFWLTDYLPEILEIDRCIMPSLSEVQRHLGATEVVDVPIPHDCIDGFLGAYWRRPEAYLRADVRSSISSLARLRDPEPGLAAPRADLESGARAERYGDLLARSELDIGYRLVIS
jgi:SAM-dependent methyltransferase